MLRLNGEGELERVRPDVNLTFDLSDRWLDLDEECFAYKRAVPAWNAQCLEEEERAREQLPRAVVVEEEEEEDEEVVLVKKEE